jgi:hypothetical protein
VEVGEEIPAVGEDLAALLEAEAEEEAPAVEVGAVHPEDRDKTI